jgi:site-specific recombinase XerD
MNENHLIYCEFLRWLSVIRSEATVQSYRWGLKVFFDWLGERPLKDLKQGDFVSYLVFLREDRKVGCSTQAIYITALKTLWQWLFDQKLVGVEKKIIPTPSNKDKKHYPYITPDDYNRLSSCLSEMIPEQLQDKLVLSMLYATGVRLGELLKIDIQQVDINKKSAVIKTFKRSNHERQIYWSEDTNDLLIKWLAMRREIESCAKLHSAALFISLSYNVRGKRLCKDHVQKLLRTLRKRAGIVKPVSAHSFRHGFGYRAVKNDIHPRYLQVMLGHARLDNTMIYMSVDNKDVERAYRLKMDEKNLTDD